MHKLHPDFPVFVFKNWHNVTPEHFDKLIPIIKNNKAKHLIQGAGSFWLMDDTDGTFKVLYDKFFAFITEKISFTPTPDNIRYCNVYYSTDTEMSNTLDGHGRLYYHNHKHVMQSGNPTTLAAVYYMNIPDPNSGFIDFSYEEEVLDDGTTSRVDEDARYHMFSPRPVVKQDKVKTYARKEISYQPENGDLVVFPAYLDHRPHPTQKPGHRVAVNFELKTVQSAKAMAEMLEQMLNQ